MFCQQRTRECKKTASHFLFSAGKSQENKNKVKRERERNGNRKMIENQGTPNTEIEKASNCPGPAKCPSDAVCPTGKGFNKCPCKRLCKDEQ